MRCCIRSMRFNKIVFVISFLLNLIFTLQVFAGITGYYLDYFFSSDALYLPSLYRDLIVDKSGLNGWYLNLAPNFIPEWPIYFVIEAITSNFRLTHVLYATISVLFIMILTTAIFKRVANNWNPGIFSIFNYGLSIFLLICIIDGDFISTSFILMSGFHAGSFLMSLLSYYLFISYLKTKKTSFIILLCATIFSGIISDVLLLALFILPSMFSLVYVRNQEYGAVIFRSTIVIAASTLIGLVIIYLSKSAGLFSIDSHMNRLAIISGILPSLNSYLDTLRYLFMKGGITSIMMGISSLGLGSGVFLLIRYLLQRSYNNNTNTLEKLVVLIFTSTIILVAVFPVLNGYFKGFAHLRYNYFSFYYAIFLFCFILIIMADRWSWFIKLLRNFSYLIALLLIMIIIRTEFANSSIQGIKRTIHYYPEKVALIDSLATRYDLKYGVGSYWNSKYTTMFSKSGIRIYCVLSDFRPWYHVVNSNWYLQNGKGRHSDSRFNFILLEDYTLHEKTIKFFKGQIDTISLSYINIGLVQEFRFDNKRQPHLVLKDNIK